MIRKFKFVLFLIIIPGCLTKILFHNGFQVETGNMLSLLLQLVWGVMIALGGGIVFLSKFKFSNGDLQQKTWARVTIGVQNFALPLLLHTLVFIFLSILYPLRNFLKLKFAISEPVYIQMGSLADSALFSLMVTPSIGSLIVGFWCIYLALNHRTNE